MPIYISLINFTEQGIRTIQDLPQRFHMFKFMAEKLGVTVKSLYYTAGHYDAVLVLEGTDEAVTTALLKVGSVGNVRSQTLRAFSLEEMERIVSNLPGLHATLPK